MSERPDGINWHAHAHIAKYSPDVVEELTRVLGYEPKSVDFLAASADPFAITEVDGNILVSTGISNLTNLIIGGGGNAFTSALGICGVGATATAAVIGNTALGSDGASAWYQGLDGTPTRSTVTATNDTITAVATYVSANANFAWNEWCWAVTTTGTITGNATLATVSSGAETMLNRKVASMGTKASGASWVFTTTVALA